MATITTQEKQAIADEVRRAQSIGEMPELTPAQRRMFRECALRAARKMSFNEMRALTGIDVGESAKPVSVDAAEWRADAELALLSKSLNR